jgi:hypothetical protein
MNSNSQNVLRHRPCAGFRSPTWFPKGLGKDFGGH